MRNCRKHLALLVLDDISKAGYNGKHGVDVNKWKGFIKGLNSIAKRTTATSSADVNMGATL